MNEQTQAHLDTLRGFWRRRFPENPFNGSNDWGQERGYLEELSSDMVRWAIGIDTEVEPASFEDAIVRGAACVIMAACDKGQLVGCEVLIFPPEQKTHDGSGQWRLCWEAGPGYWGVNGAVVPDRYRRSHPFLGPIPESGPWHVEPYYQFDICYCDERDC